MTVVAENLPLEQLVDRAGQAFRELWGRTPDFVAAAPGRVNLIGEHTDYNGGFVLPMGIERYTVLAAGKAADQTAPHARVRLHSQLLGESCQFEANGSLPQVAGHWSNYVRGVVAGCSAEGLVAPGFDAVIDSTVPAGGGLSSSAALEVASATLIEALVGRQLDPTAKALICQRAEHEYAGVPCGIMDQFAAIFARRDHLLLLDCRSQTETPVPFDDPGVSVLISNSRVKHKLSSEESPYAQRRADCETAARQLGVTYLRDVSSAQLAEARDRLPQTVYLRARHVVGEIERTLEAAAAIGRGEWAEVGRLMYASHASLRDDFAVSCPELDLLVELARGVGTQAGVIGSRMTGGGFGGCTVTLLHTDRAGPVSQHLHDEYQRAKGG